MAVGSPEASSTPKIYAVKGRPGVRDESIQSPICEGEESSDSDSEINSELDSYDEDFSDECPVDNIQENNNFSSEVISIALVVLAVSVVCAALWLVDDTPIDNLDENISKEFYKFPEQGKDFWLNIQVAISDIKNFEQPKCIIFLHENDCKDLEGIINSVSNIAINTLSSNSVNPLILTPKDFNKEDVLNDYGTIIVKNKDKLEKTKVMIVRELEKISGYSAQAFHSFCDEYNPIIKKALFLFTINVSELPVKPTEYLRSYLRLQWSDLQEDKFAPLFSRISSFILPIVNGG